MSGRDFVRFAQHLFMHEVQDDEANFRDAIQQLNLHVDIAETELKSQVQKMRKAVRSLMYMPHERYMSREDKAYPGHVYTYQVTINFPVIEFQVVARQSEDSDTTMWNWRTDLFHVTVWNRSKLKGFFRKLKLPTQFLTQSAVDAETLISVWQGADKSVFSRNFPKGFGMNRYQYEKFNEGMNYLMDKHCQFKKPEEVFKIWFSVTSTVSSAV
jgi:hypothetical protein